MNAVEVNAPNLFERLKELELKTWKGFSEIKSIEILKDKKAYIFYENDEEAGYLIFRIRRRGEVYVEDLVISNPKYFVGIMLMIVKLLAPNTLVALVEPHFEWFFSDKFIKVIKRVGYTIKVKRRFCIDREIMFYVRLVYEGAVSGR